jgi:hypothetical protein
MSPMSSNGQDICRVPMSLHLNSHPHAERPKTERPSPQTQLTAFCRDRARFVKKTAPRAE